MMPADISYTPHHGTWVSISNDVTPRLVVVVAAKNTARTATDRARRVSQYRPHH